MFSSILQRLISRVLQHVVRHSTQLVDNRSSKPARLSETYLKVPLFVRLVEDFRVAMSFMEFAVIGIKDHKELNR